MTYTKPELVLLADARLAIQSNDPDMSKVAPLAEIGTSHDTGSAYEDDE